MTKTIESARQVNDLAGEWTEPVLRRLKAAGVPHISVDMEISTWRTLRTLLNKELRRRSASTRFS